MMYLLNLLFAPSQPLHCQLRYGRRDPSAAPSPLRRPGPHTEPQPRAEVSACRQVSVWGWHHPGAHPRPAAVAACIAPRLRGNQFGSFVKSMLLISFRNNLGHFLPSPDRGLCLGTLLLCVVCGLVGLVVVGSWSLGVGGVVGLGCGPWVLKFCGVVVDSWWWLAL